MNNRSKNPTAAQLSLDGKSQISLRSSPRYQVPPRLTGRDLEMLLTIYEFGGVLTTVQLSLLFFPPDIRRRLLGYAMDEDEVNALLATYPPGVINQQLELIKWLKAVTRLKDTKRASKADERLRTYLRQIQQQAPQDFGEVEVLLEKLARLGETAWIRAQLSMHLPLPVAFSNRPILPSDFVSSACKSRLRALADGGVVEMYEQPTRLSDGRAQSCWFLTRQGRTLVAQMKKVAPKELDFRPAGAYGTLHLSHRLAINDFRIAVTLACRHKGYTISQWIDDNQLKRLLAKEKVTLGRLVRDEQTRQTTEIKEVHALKIPDGYFELDLGEKGRRHCFFEFDNQTLTIDYQEISTKDFAHKIRTMSAFYRSGRYAQVFPKAGESMWYLTVTSGGERRLVHLKAITERVIGASNRALDRYWFTTSSQIPTFEDFFSVSVFDEIWLRGGQSQLWALDTVMAQKVEGK